MDPDSFFQEHGISVFAEVALDDLVEEDQDSVPEFLPSARSVIVFGREVPVPVYGMHAKEKTREMLRIAESLDLIAVRLAGLLEAEGFEARTVPLYLPVRSMYGRVQGFVRLKHIAEAGGLGWKGKNTVLLTRRFGPRLLLLGVVTSRPAPVKGRVGAAEDPICTNCGRCIRICPTGTLGPDGVDAFRCRTLSAVVPAWFVPAVQWMLRRIWLQRCIAPFAPWIARTATIRCSLCITECPLFDGAEEGGKRSGPG